MLAYIVTALGLALTHPATLLRTQGLARCSAIGMQAAEPAAGVTLSSGLRYVDNVVGSGELAQKGSMVKVGYSGALTDGTEFDSSKGGAPIVFELGAGRVIPGWDEGIRGMKVGGKRTLYVPSQLGYGEQGAGSAIPPNSDLVFETELVGLAEGVEAAGAKVPGACYLHACASTPHAAPGRREETQDHLRRTSPILTRMRASAGRRWPDAIPSHTYICII